MARKRKAPDVYRPPRPTTPIAKLQDKIGQLHSLASAANPDSMAPYPPQVRAPKHIEAAANQVSQHIDGVLKGARQSVTANLDRAKKSKAKKQGTF